MQITATMANGNGIAHGGYLFLLAETTFSYACSIPGTTLAQSAHIVFLRPASVGDELIAEAAVRSRFGRIGVYDVSMRRADGTMIAEFRGVSRYRTTSSEHIRRGRRNRYPQLAPPHLEAPSVHQDDRGARDPELTTCNKVSKMLGIPSADIPI
jgi:phenylacetic acid degradation protein PaaD